MAQRYLLNCPECQQDNEIGVAQAGQTLACNHCENELSVGAMREIRQLPPVESEPSAGKSAKKKAAWSPHRRWIFVLGLAILVFGAIWGTMSLVTATGQYEARPEFRLSESDHKGVDMSNSAQLLDAWGQLEGPDALDVWTQPEYLAAQAQSARTRSLGLVGLGIAGFGLITMLAMVAIKF